MSDNHVSCCSISSDKSFIVSGSHDETLKLWNTETAEELRTFLGHSSNVRIPFDFSLSWEQPFFCSYILVSKGVSSFFRRAMFV